MKDFIKKCQEAYFAGTPLISNEEYDAIIKRFPELEDDIGQAGEVQHLFRMWSLEKKYPCRGDELPSNLEKYIKTPKLDGCAVDLLYVDAKLQQALTRGDGIRGRDVTENVRQLVPAYIETDDLMVQITGEVCVSKEVENMRNYASGAVSGLKDPKEFSKRILEGGLLFVAYGVQVHSSKLGVKDYYEDDMLDLHLAGGSRSKSFHTVTSQHIQALCESGAIPTDGEVYRLNSNDEFNNAGFTHKFPKGSWAVKTDAKEVWTTLRNVTWALGKSGKLTPTAEFDEIEIGGAKISKATLNNVAYMAAMGITHIGQRIGVIRSGDIIPRIVEVEPYEL